MPAIDQAYSHAMAATQLRNLDLNLLLALDALLTERNVTRAAERLGLSQPAVSAALGRLRRHFGDELLLRTGNRYELTPLAQQLSTRTTPALAGVQRVFDASTEFDPATSEREFTIMISDYAATVFGDRLVTMLANDAPGIRLRFQQTDTTLIDHALEILRSVDGLILPHGFLTDIPSTNLFEDTWVCVVSKDNDEVGAELTMADLTRLHWLVTFELPTAYTSAARQLRMMGVEPQVQVVVDSFLAVPFLVAGTSRVALLQRKLASRFAETAGVRVLPCPWDVIPVKEAFWWHPVLRHDPGHTWLRHILRTVGRGLEDRR
jgi:DNA-binding transcriptional LysR family regulator